MRPRVFPAEDERLAEQNGLGSYASMRPRVFPAEDTLDKSTLESGNVASMRPRVFPAEDRWCGATRRRGCRCRFNEAAGIPRGRLVDLAAWVHAEVAEASMRPRVFPAEDPGRSLGGQPIRAGLQ